MPLPPQQERRQETTRRPPEPSSYGSAAAASLSGSITGLCNASNATPLLHACAMSRTAAGMRQLPKSTVAMRRPPNALPCWLHGLRHWQNLRSQLVPMPDLAATLVGTTCLTCPVLPSRCLLPPTLTNCWGGFQCQLRPCWCERPHLVARLCRHLRLPQ